MAPTLSPTREILPRMLFSKFSKNAFDNLRVVLVARQLTNLAFLLTFFGEVFFERELILCYRPAIDLQHLAVYKPTVFRTQIRDHGTDIIGCSKATGRIFLK